MVPPEWPFALRSPGVLGLLAAMPATWAGGPSCWSCLCGSTAARRSLSSGRHNAAWRPTKGRETSSVSGGGRWQALLARMHMFARPSDSGACLIHSARSQTILLWCGVLFFLIRTG